MVRLRAAALLLALLSVLVSIRLAAQSPGKDQRPGFFLAGALVNGVTGGIGGLLQRPEDMRPGKAFLRGFGVGAAGGLLQQSGMAMSKAIYTREQLAYAWPATLVHAAGTSLVENATLGRAPLSHWHLNLYFTRLDYDLLERRFRARLLASSVVGAIVIGREARLNLGRSLATGTLYHDSRGLKNRRSVGNFTFLGRAYATSVATDESGLPGSQFYETSAHEHVHVLQYNGLVQVNAYLTPAFRRAQENWKPLGTAARFVYLDLNGLTLLCLYHGVFGGPNQACYYDNRLERMAEHYSNGVRPKCF